MTARLTEARAALPTGPMDLAQASINRIAEMRELDYRPLPKVPAGWESNHATQSFGMRPATIAMYHRRAALRAAGGAEAT